LNDYAAHLYGNGAGIGIGPLRRDGSVTWAAVDLDTPDLEAASIIRKYMPGPAFIERSRSKGYHVHVFFTEPIAAKPVRALLRYLCEAAGRPEAEVFPKQDRLKPDMLGSYVNLPFHGDDRPVLWADTHGYDTDEMALDAFLEFAEKGRIEPNRWLVRVANLGLDVTEPAERREHGLRDQPHGCAGYIYEHRETNPLQPGARNMVLFALSKMLLDSVIFDLESAYVIVSEVNAAGTEPLDASEVRRIVNSARRGGYTSTSCDAPEMAPYVSPECHIAHP
jgi:hypothetical protein